MLSPFFSLAMLSPGRQRTFRLLVCAHVLVLGTAAVGLCGWRWAWGAPVLGNLLLVTGIVEGALVLGWRLTQVPKSQALEFLLVSPLRPARVFLLEASVGLARLGLVTLAGLPVLAVLILEGLILPADLVPLLVMPLTWGAVTGLGLTAWAYEPPTVRRWGERVVLALVILYLLVGVLAGEHLRDWLSWLPGEVGASVMDAFLALHLYSPFQVMKFAMENDPLLAWPRLLTLGLVGLAIVGVLLARAAWRLHGHFQDRHYRPVVEETRRDRGVIGERPLAWWAVRRVTEYSGRINLWLAGGFGVLYALYTLAGPDWPDWLGHQVFAVFDSVGGIPVLATALVLLAAVPAAFQYGLWDSNAQDRCRRLELLLLTRLEARDYWEAAVAAAWRRGRGYFAVAGLLWAAGAIAGQVAFEQIIAALAAAVVLWGLYFALGFRAFARGMQANTLGLLLTVGLPLLALLLYQADLAGLAALVPPGSVFQPTSAAHPWSWLPGPLLGGATALLLTRLALIRCEEELRRWYDMHHGG
jgi:hypothetical protein